MNIEQPDRPQPPRKPSILLPAGATLAVIAVLVDSIGSDATVLITMSAVGGLTALGAWILALFGSPKLDPARGVRFLSVAAIALAVSGLFRPQDHIIGLLGIAGLWVAVGGAAIEWRRGRTYEIQSRR